MPYDNKDGALNEENTAPEIKNESVQDKDIDDAETATISETASEAISADSDEADVEQLSFDINEEQTNEAKQTESEEQPSEDEADGHGLISLFTKQPAEYNPEKPRRVDGRFDFAELLIFTLAAVFILTTFFFRHSVVDGDSMQNTLQDKEVLIISSFFYTPERYDIVVLEDHSTGIPHPIVKRVIATEGETVKITADGKITVDGTELTEPYVFTDAGDIDGDGEDDYRYTPLVYTVPEGEIFVMGDHRNNSTDSRIFYGVSKSSVLGKVLFRLFPFDKFGSVYEN